ncbi:hypothetical protein [Natrinema longum]|nr:hypothetical protein [Natrinema longum]
MVIADNVTTARFASSVGFGSLFDEDGEQMTGVPDGERTADRLE